VLLLLFRLRTNIGHSPVCVSYTAIMRPMTLLCGERVGNDISYNKCAEQNAGCNLSQTFRDNLPESPKIGGGEV
jgi:hypothetical protein